MKRFKLHLGLEQLVKLTGISKGDGQRVTAETGGQQGFVRYQRKGEVEEDPEKEKAGTGRGERRWAWKVLKP